MFKLILQLHGGKGSSTTNVQSYTPTEQEIRLQQQAADYSEAVAPNALRLNTVANGLLLNSLGEAQVDYKALNNNAQNQIANAQAGVTGLTQGLLPTAYQENMENSIKSGVQNSMGSMLNDLGARGVLNSSVTNTGLKGISDSAAEAMANAYTNNISQLSQLYGQQIDGSTAGITAGAAAQEAAQQPALNLWNASLGLNSGGTLGALAGVSGKGTTTSTQNTSGGSGLFGGLLTGYAGNAAGVFCFTEETKVKTPTGDKEIRHLHVGDTVICPNIYGGEDATETIKEVLSPKYADVYSVVCDNNKVVNTTLKQPLLDNNRKWITVEKVTVGTKLKDVGTVKSIVYSGERKVYDLKVTGDNAYYANEFIAKGGANEW